MEMWKILYILFCIKNGFLSPVSAVSRFSKIKNFKRRSSRSELVLLKLRRLVFCRVGGVFGPLPVPPGFPEGEDPSDQEDHGDDGEVAAVDYELGIRSTSDIKSTNVPKQSKAKIKSY